MELAPHIRVASAMPGVVDTPMQAALRRMQFPNVRRFRDLAENTAARGTAKFVESDRPPEDALDQPENVADFLAWLLLDVPLERFGGREWNISDASTQDLWLTASRERCKLRN